MPRDTRYLGRATGYADRQKSPLASSSMNRSTLQEEALRPPPEYEPRRKDNLFLWTVFLLLLVGITMACWVGSYVVFSRPELPISYRILRKIKKIDLPQRFKVNAAPQGEFLGPEKIFNRYHAMNGPQLREANRALERLYLRNYAASNPGVPYITGRFTILETFELHSTDFIPSGVVALAVSSDFPKLLIEHIYSAPPSEAALIKKNLQTGMDIELRRTYELTAVLHATKLEDGRVQLTVVPINYGAYEFKGSSGGFRLEPPTELRVAAGWPIIRGDRRERANTAYLDYRTRTGIGPLLVRKEDAARPPTALKGVDSPIEDEPPAPSQHGGSPAATLAKSNVTPPPSAKATPPDVRKATPVGPGSTPAPATLARNDVPVRAALPVNDPAQSAVTAQPGVVSAVAPSRGSAVPLQPFLTAPGAAASPAEGNVPKALPVKAWRTYAAGTLPPGRSVRISEVADLSQRGALAGAPVYLTGQFVVRAVGENEAKGIKKAVLRSSAQGNVRILVEYPPDRSLPAEGSEISRDEQRPYQITDVRQTSDGTFNVYAREISD